MSSSAKAVFRRSRAIIAALAFVGALLAAPASAQVETRDAWAGIYSYTEDGGRTAGGSTIMVTHEIAITRDGARYRAEITANGYQTARQISAVGEAAGNRLVLRFEREGADHMFKGQHKPGEILLELERAGQRVLTHWRGPPGSAC